MALCLNWMILKICDQNGTLFKLDERDVSDVPMDQTIKKLPVANLITKGKRVFLSV